MSYNRSLIDHRSFTLIDDRSLNRVRVGELGLGLESWLG